MKSFFSFKMEKITEAQNPSDDSISMNCNCVYIKSSLFESLNHFPCLASTEFMDVLNEYWQLFHTFNHLQTEALTHKAPEPAVMQRWKVREAETDRETELSDANSGSPGVARPCRSAALFCAAQTLSQALSCLPVSPLAFLLSVSTSLFFFLSRPLLPRSRQKSKTHPKSSGFPPPSQTERGAHTKCVWRQKAYINLTPLCSAGSEMILSDQRVYLFNISSWPTHCFFWQRRGCECLFAACRL